MKKADRRKKNELLFLTGSVGYPALELLWRGRTHYSMALAGGICLILIDQVCCEKMRNRRIGSRCLMGSAIITGVEFSVGLVFNDLMGLNVWDYSNMPLNIMGQICLPYSLLWVGLSLPAMALCNACKKSKILS